MSTLLGRILIYSIEGCRHCKTAKALFTELQLPFTDVSVDKYQASVGAELRERTGKTSVPQIYFNSDYIGGNEELQKLYKDSEAWTAAIEKLKTTSVPSDAPKLPEESLRLEETHDKRDFVCEPDEYARMVSSFKDSGLIKDHRQGIFNKKKTFTGADFVDWALESLSLDEGAALEKGQYLLDHHFAHSLSGSEKFEKSSSLYRLLEDDDSSALNQGDTSDCVSRTVNELGEDLRKLILKIYNKNLSADGRKVDYAGIGASEEFKIYTRMTLLLHRVQIEEASREEKLAFFINVYNALVIHANVIRGPPQTMWQRYKFFNGSRYIIGGHSYSLQDIENGVLRANRKKFALTRPFGSSDPRLKVALEKHEPLIHFALVCGAKSCPPIKTYSADGVMDQLKLAAEAFMEGDDVSIDAERSQVSLSKIFSWYREDFGENNDELLQWVQKNMAAGEKKAQLQKMIEGGKVKVTFIPYDWGTNS